MAKTDDAFAYLLTCCRASINAIIFCTHKTPPALRYFKCNR